MWSFDGVKFSDAEPMRFTYGERVRIMLVNDTMMDHPIHLHGMWSELENERRRIPAAQAHPHVQPGHARDLSRAAPMRWAAGPITATCSTTWRRACSARFACPDPAQADIAPFRPPGCDPGAMDAAGAGSPGDHRQHGRPTARDEPGPGHEAGHPRRARHDHADARRVRQGRGASNAGHVVEVVHGPHGQGLDAGRRAAARGA